MAAAAAAAALVAHHLLRPSSLLLPKLFHPSSFSRTVPTPFPLHFFSTPSSLTHLQIPTSLPLHNYKQDEDDDDEEDSEYEDEYEFEDQKSLSNSQQQSSSSSAAAAAVITDSIRNAIQVPVTSPILPKLSVKEKKELASYARSLGKKLKYQQVGKSGVTPSVAAAFVENLESNELLKLKVHNSCPGELLDVIKQLEDSTGSVAVGQIGRAVILYRPSLAKLKASEKKKVQSQRIWKEFTTKPKVQKVKVMRSSHRGHRGNSRFEG